MAEIPMQLESVTFQHLVESWILMLKTIVCVKHIFSADIEDFFQYYIKYICQRNAHACASIRILIEISKLEFISCGNYAFGSLNCWRVLHLTNKKRDVIKCKHFPRYWPFVRGIHRSPVNSPHKGHWRGALMFSLICVWINGWVNNGEAGDLRRYRAH